MVERRNVLGPPKRLTYTRSWPRGAHKKHTRRPPKTEAFQYMYKADQ